MNKNLGIYIHIPFCVSKCHYCDFTSFKVEDNNTIEKYIDSLCNEILSKAEILSERNIVSIYFGGGTPSYIDSKYIKQIIETLKLICYIEDDISITIEINPKTLTMQKALDYYSIGVNRASIGLQSTHDDILKSIGRVHNLKDFEDTLNYLKEANINNVSCDLMYPLPGLTIEKFKSTLNYVVGIEDIKHISIYNLEVHEGSKLDFLLKEGYLSLPNEDDEYLMRNMIDNVLTNNNYFKYEISNYSKKGFESIHNLMYWNQGEYLGFGVNSSSFINSTRFTNTASLNSYINCFTNIEYILADEAVTVNEDLTEYDLKKEYVILKLRLMSGISTIEYFNKFKSNILEDFKEAIDDNISKGLLILVNINKSNNDDVNLTLTKRGMEVANIVWESFL